MNCNTATLQRLACNLLLLSILLFCAKCSSVMESQKNGKISLKMPVFPLFLCRKLWVFSMKIWGIWAEKHAKYGWFCLN